MIHRSPLCWKLCTPFFPLSHSTLEVDGGSYITRAHRLTHIQQLIFGASNVMWLLWCTRQTNVQLLKKMKKPRALHITEHLLSCIPGWSIHCLSRSIFIATSVRVALTRVTFSAAENVGVSVWLDTMDWDGTSKKLNWTSERTIAENAPKQPKISAEI